MVSDGFVLPDKELAFNPRFNLGECLLAFHSFLRNYRVGEKPFDLYTIDLCKQNNVNVRLILPFLQMGSGLLSRKVEPNAGILRYGIRLPDGFLKNGKNFEDQLVNCVKEFRRYCEVADLKEPIQLKDGVVVPKSRVSAAILLYLGELGKSEYPDSGGYAYLRYFNQLGRFARLYA